MGKQKNSSIYHFENYIQVQKINHVLKTWFSNKELTLPAETIEILHTIETKWSITIYWQTRILTV